MEKDFCMGIIAGLAGGMIIAANSFKVRKAVKDGQEKILTALNKRNDKKEELENKREEQKPAEQSHE